MSVFDFLPVGLAALFIVPVMLWWTRAWTLPARCVLLTAVCVLIAALLVPQSIYLGILRALAVEWPWIAVPLEFEWTDHVAHFVLFAIAGVVFAAASGPSGHRPRLVALTLLAVSMEALQVGVEDHAVRLADGAINVLAALFGYGLIVVMRLGDAGRSDASG